MACAAVAVFIALLSSAATLTQGNWNLDLLVHVSDDEPLAAEIRRDEPDFAFVPPGVHYDGVYFYAIARDPLLLGVEHHLIDRPAYRFGHPGFGWLAFLASAGQASLIPEALFILNLLAVAAAAALVSLIAHGMGWSRWTGLIVALHPGVSYAVNVDTSEALALLGIAGIAFLWTRERYRSALLVLALLCLVKEQYALVAGALVLWEFARSRRQGRPFPWRRAAATFLAVVPLVIWYLYVALHYRRWPFIEVTDTVVVPFLGWAESLHMAAIGSVEPFAFQLGQPALVTLVAVLAVLVIATARSIKLRTIQDALFLAQVPLVFMLGWPAIAYPKDLLRQMVVPLILAIAVIAGSRRPHPEASAAEGARKASDFVDSGARSAEDNVTRPVEKESNWPSDDRPRPTSP